MVAVVLNLACALYVMFVTVLVVCVCCLLAACLLALRFPAGLDLVGCNGVWVGCFSCF